MRDKIFHQVVRYEYAKSSIEAMRTKETHTILEVGSGAHGNLAQYLPKDDIVFLDLELPEDVLKDPRFVVGDATNLAYGEDSFDYIIALDVVEHIPTEKREAFIANINRVAKLGVVLSAPIFSEQSPHEDELLKSFYTLEGQDPPAWIDEHIDCTLPKTVDLLQLVRKQNVEEKNIVSFFGVKRSLMQKMLIMEAVASQSERLTNVFDVINSDYIQSVMREDSWLPERESMKLYLVWSKCDGRILNVVEHKEHNEEIITCFETKCSILFNWALEVEGGRDLKRLDESLRTQLQPLLPLVQETVQKTVQKTVQETVQETIQETTQGFEKQLSVLSLVEENIQKLVCQKEQIKLNVVLITYNHEKYIEQTLQTILMQETNFKFNILIADDCSTDNTLNLIRQIETTTDIPFIYLPNDHNLGIMQNYKRSFAACDADYVAIMEGDDLWTDKGRLQKHVDFLNNHTECAMTFNRFAVKDFEKDTVNIQPTFAPIEEEKFYKYITGHDLAYSNLIGNFSTCVYRNSALKMLPDQLFSIKCYDWLTNIMVSKSGLIGCLIQPMSIYRIHSAGVWSGQSQREQIQSIVDAIEIYDEYTNREFTAGFSAHKERLLAQLRVPEEQVGVRNEIRKSVKRVLKAGVTLRRYVPPIFLCVIKLLIPRAIAEKIASKI